jgi:hypothetical protein
MIVEREIPSHRRPLVWLERRIIPSTVPIAAIVPAIAIVPSYIIAIVIAGVTTTPILVTATVLT